MKTKVIGYVKALELLQKGLTLKWSHMSARALFNDTEWITVRQDAYYRLSRENKIVEIAHYTDGGYDLYKLK
jgi:hypothetical protein